jgi:toxin ParE1/3/4
VVRGQGSCPRQVVKQRLIIAPLAEADIKTSFLWYEERTPGLGEDFMQRVDAELAVIDKSPQLFRKRFGLYRLAATERFPYSILFHLG